MLAKFVTQLVSALWNGTDAAPFPVTDFEDLVHQILGDAIASALHDTRILIFHLVGPGFQLAHRHEHTFQDIDRLKAGDDDRHPESLGDRFVFAISHYGANM